MELAARIGQTLLEKNKELAEQNEILEEQVAEANERVSGRDVGLSWWAGWRVNGLGVRCQGGEGNMEIIGLAVWDGECQGEWK